MKKLEKINDYYTRSGDRVPINLESPYLSSLVYKAMNYIKDKTNFVSESPELFDKFNRKKLYEALIDWTGKEIESKESPERYGNLRDYLLNNDGDLGNILWHRTATCRELSCFGHIVLSMYGINTKVVNGTLNNSKGHAWLKTNGSTILDFNKFRKIFNSNEYPSKNIISEQELVKQKNTK